MFDNDAIRFPQFTTQLLESLLQLPTSPAIPISHNGDGTFSPFPPFTPDDDVVEITLTLPQQTFSIPHPDYLSVYPFPFHVNQRMELVFYPWADVDDPMFLLEEAALLIHIYVDVALSKDLVCLGSDLPLMLHVYTRKAEECFESIRDHGDQIRVQAQVAGSTYPTYLDIKQLSIDIPCCVPVAMMRDMTFSGLMAAVKPWVDIFYTAEASLFQLIALTLRTQNMTLSGNTRPMTSMIFSKAVDS